MSNKSNCDTNENQLSAETIRLIEEKRRQAIERRNQSQSHKIVSQQNSMKIGSGSGVTCIKPMVHNAKVSSATTIHSQIKPYCRPNLSPQPKVPKQDLMASIRLQSNTRFEITIKYNADVLVIFKRFESRDFDFNRKMWSFGISDYKQLISELQGIPSVNIKIIESVPDSVFVSLIKAQNINKYAIDLSERLNSELVNELFPFQKDGIIFGVRNEGRCLIADDMGLGKTIQAIGLAQWYRSDWPLIIVCPSSLRFQWLNSLNRWLPDVSFNDILIVKTTKDFLPQIPITIISYDLLARMKSQLSIESKQFYNVVILDESHYIKSDVAVRTESVQLLAKSCKRIILLTGTPALSRPMELFPQINAINPKLFSSKHAFGVRYCDAQLKTIWRKGQKIQTRVWDYKGAKNLDELRILLEQTIMIRRLKKEVLNQLPKKKREMIVLSTDMSEKEKKRMTAFQNNVRKLHKTEGHTCLFEWFGESAYIKIIPVCEYLEQLIDKDVKMLCFCHHKHMMDGIEEMLSKRKVNHIRIDGSTSPQMRQEACDAFQKSDDYRVAVLSITACATGLNLTAASTVVFAEIYWNPGVLAQAEDRVHRIGQQENCRVIYLVAKDTIDDLIWPLISKKLEILNKAGLSKDNFSEATNHFNAIADQQKLMDEFLQSMSENELKTLFDDDFQIV